METVVTNFQPKQHGFSFQNSFEFPDFFQMKLLGLQPGLTSLDDLVYGLCGGMCFAALDYYNAQKAPPQYASTDKIPWPFFLYLWQRQLNSMAKTVLPKLFKWMLSDDIVMARNIKRYEVPKIITRVEQGKPAPLVLVRVKGLNDPTKNHQVLAIGYELDPETKDLAIILYDPNHSGVQPKLTMNLSDPSQGIKLAQTTKEHLRGFFVINYDNQAPPNLNP